MWLSIQEEKNKEKTSNYQKLLCSMHIVLHVNANRNNNHSEIFNTDSNVYVLEPHKFNGLCQILNDSKNVVSKDANTDK